MWRIFFSLLYLQRRLVSSPLLLFHFVSGLDLSIPMNQSQVSIQVRWSVLSNHRSEFRSRDQYCPIRAQYSGQVFSIVQYELSITWRGGCGASRADPRGRNSDKAQALTQSRAAAWLGPVEMSSFWIQYCQACFKRILTISTKQSQYYTWPELRESCA